MSHWQRAWITGASQGIGRALSLRLLDLGVEVFASARSAQPLAQLVEAGSGRAGRIHALPLDVTDADAVQSTYERIVAAGGPPDLVVLNAGTHRPTPAADFRSEDLRSLVEVNLLGVANGLQTVLPPLRERGRGQIAVVASLAGYRGLPTAAAYGASKAAVINLCESLRLELRDSGVDLRLVNPGFVKTPLTDRNEFPMPFLISAEAAADAIVAGLRGRRFEIRFPTRFALIMGALRHLPHGLYAALVGRATGYG